MADTAIWSTVEPPDPFLEGSTYETEDGDRVQITDIMDGIMYGNCVDTGYRGVWYQHNGAEAKGHSRKNLMVRRSPCIGSANPPSSIVITKVGRLYATAERGPVMIVERIANEQLFVGVPMTNKLTMNFVEAHRLSAKYLWLANGQPHGNMGVRGWELVSLLPEEMMSPRVSDENGRYSPVL